MSSTTSKSRKTNWGVSQVKGFGTGPTEQQIINKIISTTRAKVLESHGLDPYGKSHVDYQRTNWESVWNRQLKQYPLESSKSLLLDPSFSKPLDVVRMENTTTKNGDTIIHRGWCGRWKVDLIEFGEWVDFSISALIPSYDKMGFIAKVSPKMIQRAITSTLGHNTFKKWKELQLADLPSLRRLINEIKETIDYPAQSLTCGEKSKKLCERVGVPICSEYAFLIPNSML